MSRLKGNKKRQNIKALYGIFNIDMLPINTIDVTEKVKEFVVENIITIPKKDNFNEWFSSNIHGQKKYLQISSDENVYNIADDQYAKDICINLAETAKHIKIVYYLYLNPNSNWRGIVSGQLLQLKSYGILSEADLYIHITDCYNIKHKVVELINEIVPEAILSFNYENIYEYPGLKLIYDLSNHYPQDNFIYFHAKGMSYNVHSRSIEEITLFEKTFENWRKNMQFLNERGVKKIGLFPAIWFEKPVRLGEL